MISFPRGVTTFLLTLGAVFLPGSGRVSGPGPVSKEMSTQVAYGPLDREFYLASDTVSFVRPGFKIKVQSVTIGADRKPVVDVKITDGVDQPIDRLGIQTPGVVTTSWVLSWWNPASRDYTAYTTRQQTSPITGVTATQAGTDTGGVYKDIELGHFTYTFGTVLPAGFDQTKTLTLGSYGSRTMPAEVLDGKAYIANAEFDFRADGGAITDKWAMINDATSCANCHDPLGAHGGVRQDVKLCVLCHSPQTVDPDTGNTVDFKVMIHKIHAGANLPSVKAGTPYVIIGNAQSVNDFSGVTYPQDLRNCANCHEGTVPASKPAQAANWYSYPSSATCGSCHDDLNFTTGANHPAGPALDANCANCHRPTGDSEWDAGIQTAHVVPLKSKQLKGLVATIVAVDNVGAGKKPVVTFKLTNGDGSIIDPKFFATAANGSLSVVLGGPTSDYGAGAAPPAQPFSENASGAVFNGTVAVYSMTNAVPAAATGTWAVAIQLRRTVALSPSPTKGPASESEPPTANPVFYIAVTGGAPTPRRTSVTLAQCNTCHDRLDILFSHGSQRVSLQFCVICHNPNGDDSPVRAATAGKPESISFGRMMHRIHTGNELTNDFTVWGFGGTFTSFNNVTYPGDRRDCLKCHTNAAAFTPPSGILPVVTQRDYFSPQGSSTSACLGCHDNVDAAAHAYLNTVTTPFFGEACATCHGTGKDWDAAKVHAR